MANDFRLSDSFIEEYKNKEPAWGPIGYFTYKTKYARPVENENRTEEWWETVKRVVEGCYNIQKKHCDTLTLPWNHRKAQTSAQEMYRLIFSFKFLPPGRGLWMMGTPFVDIKGSAALNNCAFVSTKDINIDFAEPFCFLMDMSMLGVGVGGDTKGTGTIRIKEPRQGTFTFVVKDSREGWVELIRTILDAYVNKGSLPETIDYSEVRPYGSPIKSFGGIASGPKYLQELVDNIHIILTPLIDEQITSEAIVDIFNAIGKCVVSGNVRRSAEIMIGEPDDDLFLDLKNPTIPKSLERMSSDKGWRWASNNTVFATVGMDYSKPANHTKENGEIGYFWLNTAREYGRLIDPPSNIDILANGCNPCSEQTLESYELCCLVETFPAFHNTYEEYERTLKFAYLYAKTVTLVPTHNARTNAVMLRNRRIGTSQSGIAQSFKKHGIREHFNWCDKGYKYINRLDKTYSQWLCIPTSIKTTSVKPSGSVSLLCGATPGIHFPLAEYYWRTQRLQTGSPFLRALKDAGYRVERENDSTEVVYFPVKEIDFWRAKDQVSMWEQLEIAAQMQAYWADNQVSVTISFNKEEAEWIPLALQLYETRLKSVSFLPLMTIEEMNKAGYSHPPYQPISKDEYEKETKKLKPINIKSAESKGYEHSFCDSDKCELDLGKK